MTPDEMQIPLTDDLVIDLLEDSREVAGVLGGGLEGVAVQAYPQVPGARRRPDLAVAAASLDGYADYGS